MTRLHDPNIDVQELRGELQWCIRKCLKAHESPILYGLAQAEYEAVITDCRNIAARISADDLDDGVLNDVMNDVLKQKAAVVRLLWKYTVLPAVLALIVFVFLFEIYSGQISLTGMVQEPLTQFTLLGVFGVCLYFATDKLADIAALKTIHIWLLRLFIAVVIPFVLVVVFVDGDGKIVEKLDGKKATSLLSFACGFSATLVTEFMNKLVDKARNMVKVL